MDIFGYVVACGLRAERHVNIILSISGYDCVNDHRQTTRKSSKQEDVKTTEYIYTRPETCLQAIVQVHCFLGVVTVNLHRLIYFITYLQALTGSSADFKMFHGPS